jgi:hypothetical protein
MFENKADVDRKDENPIGTLSWHLKVWFWVTFGLGTLYWVCSILTDQAHKLPPPH